jgi:hypothetical protein
MVNRAVVHHQDTARLGPWVHIWHEVLDELYEGVGIVCTLTYIGIYYPFLTEGG